MNSGLFACFDQGSGHYKKQLASVNSANSLVSKKTPVEKMGSNQRKTQRNKEKNANQRPQIQQLTKEVAD